jgi:DNA polymerase
MVEEDIDAGALNERKSREAKLSELRKEAEVCKKCVLHKSRIKSVFGEGPSDAKIMLVGESPGVNENIQGKPFVGSAGRILDELLRSIDVKREDVYICNVTKCHPPGNRDPAEEEMEACSTYLRQQVAIIRPKLIIALGRISARSLLGRPVVISKEHGSLLDCIYAGVNFKLFLTYHPAAAIYSGRTRRELQADFLNLKQILKTMIQ